MEEYLERFLNYTAQRNTGSKHTLDAYRRDLEQFFLFLKREGVQSLEEVDRIVLMNYIASISEDDKGNQRRASTISRKISSIRSFYRYLNEYVGVLNNPLEYIKGPKAPKRIPEFMFIEEIRTFLDSIDDSTLVGKRDRAMFELMYACGLRVSEVTTLQIEDLDFDDHILHVRGKGDKERATRYPTGRYSAQDQGGSQSCFFDKHSEISYHYSQCGYRKRCSCHGTRAETKRIQRRPSYHR